MDKQYENLGKSIVRAAGMAVAIHLQDQMLDRFGVGQALGGADEEACSRRFGDSAAGYGGAQGPADAT